MRLRIGRFSRGDASLPQSVLSERIARRIADLLEPELKAYQRFLEHTSGDRKQALHSAARLYAAVGEVQYQELDAGWWDERAVGALILLSTVADGYALHVVDWPDGVPEDAIPTAELLLETFSRFGLRRWMADIQGTPKFAASHPTFSVGELSAVEKLETDATLEELRANEKPHDPQFAKADEAAAAQVNEWAPYFFRASELLTSPATAAATAERLARGRTEIVHELEFLRRWIPRFVRHGMRAEAIASMSLVLNMIRTLILAGLQEHLEAETPVHLMAFEDVRTIMDRFELQAWWDSLASSQRP